MQNFRNIVYSETPPSIYSLWLKGSMNPEDPFEIRVYKDYKWEIVDRGSGEFLLEDDVGESTTSTMSQKAITDKLNNLLNQINKINDNSVEIHYDIIEYTGDSEYSVTLHVTLVGEIGTIHLCNNNGKCIPLNPGTNTVSININNNPYLYVYTVGEITVQKPIIFNVMYPMYYGISNKDISSLSPEILKPLYKEVSNSLEKFFTSYSNKLNDAYFYIIVSNNKIVQLSSNGFYIPLLEIQTIYLDSIYCIYKSMKLKSGDLQNINIKII